MQNYFKFDFENFYSVNLIIFLSSYGFFSIIKDIFFITVRSRNKSIKIDEHKTTQLSEIETFQDLLIENEKVILKKRKLI